MNKTSRADNIGNSLASSPRATDDGAAFKAATRAQWDQAAPGWNAHAPITTSLSIRRHTSPSETLR